MSMRLGTRSLLAALLLLAALSPARADERVLRFVSDVKVERGGDLLVTETIRVRAEGQSIRRGILRDFPTTYRDRNGARIEIGFTVISVTRNGTNEPFATERLSNGYRVRIGSAERTLNYGPHDYAITYRTTRQVGFFKDYDELYWNVTGTGWTFPIDVAEARITLPEAVPIIQTAVYTGPQGATGKDATIVEQGPGRIVFRTTAPLPVGHGLTVAAGWQKGIVTQPTSAELSAYWLRDNLPIVLAFAAIAFAVLYYLHAWWRAGRDPAPGTIIPLFAPPDGMSPAAVRYVWQMGMDQRVYTAALVGLAVKGHLKLVEKKSGDGMTIVPQSGGKALDGPEKAMEARLIRDRGKKVELDRKNHSVFEKSREALEEGLRGAYANKLFLNNRAWSSFGLTLVLGLCFVVLASVFAVWGAEDGMASLVGMLSFIPALIVLTVLAYNGVPDSMFGWIFTAVCVAVALFIGASGYKLITYLTPEWMRALPAALPAILVPIAASAFAWMKAHTSQGRRVVDQIEGFRQYLGVAEKDRLNFVNPPERTPELFERFLPYAIALDVENEWAEQFEDVLAEASLAPREDGSVTTWYSGSRTWRDGGATSFASYLGNELSTTIAAASTPPAASTSSSGSSSYSGGSSGGGSSGGGGGGGGGSGW